MAERWQSRPMRTSMRATVDASRVAACGWFTTVLGPGSDVPFIGLKAWRGPGRFGHLKPISLPNVSCFGFYQFERGNDGTCDGNAQEIFDFNPRLCLHGPRKTACDR